MFAAGLTGTAIFSGVSAAVVFDTQSVMAMCVTALLCTSAVIMAVLAGRQLLEHFSNGVLRLTERDFNGNFAYIAADSEGGKVAQECHRVVATICSEGHDSLDSLGHSRRTLLAWRDGLVVRAAELQHDLDTLTEVETNIGQERANDVQSVRTQAREEMEALRAEVRDLDTRAHTYREIADQFTARGDNIVRRADEELAAEHKQRRAEAALFEIAKKRQDPERRPDITG